MANSNVISKNETMLFNNLDASNVDDSNGITEIESVCMHCLQKGTTKIMLTRIPFYRDVVITSFSCEHCHMTNTGVESANKIQEKGVNIRLQVKTQADLNRELVKSDYATFKIPSIEFEIPPLTQKGFLTTIEGVLDRVISNLSADIELKKEQDEELANKLQLFIEKLNDLKNFKTGEFEVVLDDPTGDSFIENPHAPNKDPQLVHTYYTRTKEQSEFLGLNRDEAIEDQIIEEEDLADEIVQFKNNCPNCNSICDTNMKLTDIPFFKQVIIMCTVCEKCGIKSSEVKSGTGIEEKGVRYTLKITDPSDINRDLLKSETATLEIPEIEFFMDSGTLGGKFTTIEGILASCREQLDLVSRFNVGDSCDASKNDAMQKCLSKLEKIQQGELLNVTIIIDDPSGNSYLQNVYAPEDDPNMKVEHYERNFEQNELLGLNDMNTDHYKNENE